ncbi:hypothetical protein [Gemmatimonas sp.]|uniref:hypothetical protein n=1 Tax=Gemmatimonas sp. TaxID=1962908 RepID=UPI0037C09DC3
MKGNSAAAVPGGASSRPSVGDLLLVLSAAILLAWWSPLANADAPLPARTGDRLREVAQVLPGFVWFRSAPICLQLLPFLLLVLPLLPSSLRQPRTRLLWSTAMWFAGLLLFVARVQALPLWWVLALPMLRASIHRVPVSR